MSMLCWKFTPLPPSPSNPVNVILKCGERGGLPGVETDFDPPTQTEFVGNGNAIQHIDPLKYPN